MEDYLNDLNESQRRAVEYLDGPSLVIAGAGSGKTRVLTYKVAYLLNQGMKPWHILALTFTNKAAREMKERVARRVGQQMASRLWMGTFHSIFLRILHAEAAHLGFTSHFTVYDAADSKSLVRSILKDLGLDEKVYKPGVVQGRISAAKNRLMSPEAYAASREAILADQQEHIPLVRDIYKRYMARCKQSDAMDFDDLLYYTYLLFRDHPEVLEVYQRQFQFVLVDEYQDTNYAQHAIVQQLVAPHQRVCVVGDDAQSIYSFRGAEIDNILNFNKIFPSARLFKLEQNYRSTQTIVSAANSLIAKNRWQIQKEVFSKKEAGDPIPVKQTYSDTDEAGWVCNQIAAMHRRQQMGYADFAILYRTNAQSRVFEENLRKAGMPYRIYGGLSFYQRKEIKDIIAYLRLVVNPNDEEALKRIINYPARGIGETTMNKVQAVAYEHEVSLYAVLADPLSFGANLSKGTITKLTKFVEMVEGWRQRLVDSNAYEAGLAIIKESGLYADLMQDKSPEGMARQENVEEMTNGMKEFCTQRLEEGDERFTLSDYLSEVSLLSDQDSDDQESEERITLMTIHSAKGLEFRNVFVVGMEENLFPSARAMDSPRALEEERRLFYVAITRAEEHCFLSYAKMRYHYGKMEFSSPSRFLKEIDERFLARDEESRPSAFGGGEGRYGESRYGESRYGEGRYGESRYAGGSRANASQSGTMRYREEPPAGMRRLTPLSGYGSRGTSPFGNSTSGVSSSGASTSGMSARASVSGSSSSARPSATGSSSAPSNAVGGLRVGQFIEHERFGLGEVVDLQGEGDNAKATIQFKNAGVKQLLLRFARFKVVH